MSNSEVCKVKIELEYKSFKLLVTYDKSTKRYFGYLQGLAKSKEFMTDTLEEMQNYLMDYIEHNTKSIDKPELVSYLSYAMAVIYSNKDNVIGLYDTPSFEDYGVQFAMCLLNVQVVKGKSLQEVVEKHQKEIDLHFELSKY